MTTKAKQSPELDSWNGLNEAIMSSDIKMAERLLDEEKKGRKRKQFMLRLHSRINKLRADREREDIIKLAKAD